MDEAKDGAAALLAKETVVVRESAAVFRDFLNEGVAPLIGVVEMHFDVADSQPHHLRDAFQEITPVFILRVEKAMLRKLPRGIQGSVICDAGPLVAPLCETAKRGIKGCAAD
jgi:hypothetical protein